MSGISNRKNTPVRNRKTKLRRWSTEHIRNLRINKAKALLENHPNMTLADVAFSCGFKDYNYFITVFKRIVGVSPKKYASKKISTT